MTTPTACGHHVHFVPGVVRLLTVLLAISSGVLVAQAACSPGELIVKLRRSPQRGALDEITSVGVPGIDALVATQRAEASSPFQPLLRRFPEMDPVILVRANTDVDLDALESTLQRDPNVEWVTRNHHYRIEQGLDAGTGYVPNDSLFPSQWWLEKISAPLAWEITRGNPEILLGIIDTGVDIWHPDLRPNIWINEADADSDGVDDDNNGFVDDAYGWDFVDAPSLPSLHDHLVRDPDVTDDNGHGTFVAGLAAAASDNETCYASIGFNCRIMCLRAANSEGFLEEDDAAAAILYGAQMGASVLNMSFGDVVASPLLREAVRLAGQAGVTMAGSAGNEGSQSIHYPSGYPEVIAVGAVNQYDRRAGFSNYGPSVDVTAPGADLVSTFFRRDETGMPVEGCGEWGTGSGTSYATPIVTGLAGLILSVNPSLEPDDVEQIICSTADDIGSEGWDDETANGRINARRAVEAAAYGASAVARIISPRTDQGLLADFDVMGDAWGTAFDHYELSYGLGENPDAWSAVSSGSLRVHGGLLGRVILPASDSVMIVRLEAIGTDGSRSVDHVHVFVQRDAPRIDSLQVRRMLDYDSYGDLVQVWCDQVSGASLILTNTSGDSAREDFGYVSRQHAGVLSQRNHPGVWQVQVRLENASGLSALSDPFEYAVTEPPFVSNLWLRTTTSMPHGLIGPFVTDYDCDGLPEVWLQPLSETGALTDYLEPYEWSGTDFVATGNTYGFHFPRATGDADGDGLIEMVATLGDTTRIWEQSSPCGVPDHVAFERGPNALAAAIIDLDTTDGHGEIVIRQEAGYEDEYQPRYVIYSVTSDYVLVALDTVPNETLGSNGLGWPVIHFGDLDQDGLTDALYGDYDGDVIFSERDGGRFVQRWSKRLPINDATAWTAVGDFDGDGALEFTTGCRSNQFGGTESQHRARHWEYFIFERAANDSFTSVDTAFILGDEDLGEHPSSVVAGDVNGDGVDELVISAFPDFYIVARDAPTGQYVPQWYYTPSQSGMMLTQDWNGDMVRDILFSDGERFLRVESAAASGSRPSPPLNVSGEPLGVNSVTLSWQRVADADSYRVLRAATVPNFTSVAATSDLFVIFDDVPQDVTFTYTVVTLSHLYPLVESVHSNYVELTANEPPSLEDTARFVLPYYAQLRFSEPMGPSALWQWMYRLEDGRMPSVVMSSEGDRVVTLAFTGGLSDGWHLISVGEIRDAQDSRLTRHEAQVVCYASHAAPQGPAILTHRVIGAPTATRVEITFSEPMSSSVLDAAHYRMEAPRSVLSVDLRSTDTSRVEIELDPRYPVGALGLPAYVQLREISSRGGVPLDTTGGRADLLLAVPGASVDDAYVFPNPYKGVGAGGGTTVHFAGLPETATIRLFTLQGIHVRTLEHHNLTGAEPWDMKNEDGDAVAGGVYLYTIESSGKTIRGKLAVLR